jgi:AraC-like DNA-binding protein
VNAKVSTDAVDTGERFDFWHEVICNAFVRLEAESLPGSRSFRAEITNTQIGPLTLSRVAAEPHAVHRSHALIGAEPRDEVLVSIQLSGTTIVEQDDRQAVLQPGDFAMYDATRPYDLTMPRAFEQLVLQFDRRFLLERCPSPEPLTAIRMSNNSSVTAPVSAFLRSLESITLDDPQAVSHQLATSALDLLGVALADQFGGEVGPAACRTKHFLRACTYVNAYADDPDLDPQRICSAIGVSVRYLHQLFRDHDTSVNKYLMSRRLARSMDELVSPTHARRTITEIAMSHGFKTAAHFSRSFSEMYAVTPSDARRSSVTARIPG